MNATTLRLLALIATIKPIFCHSMAQSQTMTSKNLLPRPWPELYKITQVLCFYPEIPTSRKHPWLLHNVPDKTLCVPSCLGGWFTIVHHGGTKTRRGTKVFDYKIKIQAHA